MVSVQMMKPTLGLSSTFRVFDFKYHIYNKKSVLRFKKIGVSCKLQPGDSQSEERPESLFMKELRRRGITPTSLLEEGSRTTIEEDIKERGGDRSFSNRNVIATGSDKSLTNQREQSMALNSEGLEGLIPRGKLLLSLGGTFFLAFWPLILVTVASFAALYLYFGATFIHDGTDTPRAPPQYVDPYVLLQEERIAPQP